MANTSDEPVYEGKRFKADPVRIAIVAVTACGIYGSGIIMVVYAAYLTIRAVHAGQSAPVLPWAVAFVLVVSGMLGVIYGFFFRPREARLSENQIALVFWDGNGKVMDRDKVESVDVGASRIVLKSGGKRMVVGKMFSEWKALRGELGAWGGKTA
ncbi:MAG: hypothetical protein JWP91_2632 [Fibrobacteres bacterium]|nr:hypothetical protein [Fibrobacterota bacterium]